MTRCSNQDIRAWATQSDPCMSMLAEFYSANKSSEATRFLLKVLNDINRSDAVAVIERAEKSVRNVVRDQPVDYQRPPPVFISYQWAHQTDVKLLKKHLEAEGYPCWMDVGEWDRPQPDGRFRADRANHAPLQVKWAAAICCTKKSIKAFEMPKSFCFA